MNAVTSRYRTLGELMTELRARLGFVTQGSAAKNNEVVIKSFLQEAHDFVFEKLQPQAQRKKATITLQPDSYIYDWHNDAEDEPIDPGRVLSIWIIESGNKRRQLVQGISEADRANSAIRQFPQRYDHLDGQLELYPIPGQAYQMVIEYTSDKSRFEQTGDRPSVPDRLVFLYALAVAKAHYRHPDAQPAAASFQTMLDTEKMKQKENKRFFANVGEVKLTPQVARTSDGRYTLRG